MAIDTQSGFLRHAMTGFALGAALMSAVPMYASAEEVSGEFLGARSEKAWSIMLFGGPMVDAELADIVIPSGSIDGTGTTFVGVALNKRVYEFDGWASGFTIELEAGAGYQFGESPDESGQIWAAAYGRYDEFPWNHIVRTTVAASVGLNYSTEKTAYENNETKVGNTKHVLHYFSPEITFSAPSNPDDELVLRLHHRSSASGAFGCEGCGSNYITFGYRKRF
ncbi:hypothetical protein ACFQ14_13015 [Pseudahrensia aquimaris]|uniref:Outer membrane protein beta-barrel domain-containing protein n=1 Tax=Pseudahrensia aquimaris TaxID=744461 RepID=A0ABW3FIK5_9HYPH